MPAPVSPRADYDVLRDVHGVELVPVLPPRGAPGLKNELPVWFAARHAILAAADRTDAVLLLSEDVGFLTGTLLALHRRKKPVLIVYHGHAAGAKKNRALLAFLARCDFVHWLPLARSLADRLIARGVPADRVHAIGYGADTGFFHPAPDVPRDIVICSAGLAHRDYRTLVAACDGLDIPVRIAADSQWFKVDTDIDGMTLPAGITLRGAPDMAGLRDIYARSDMVVVPMDDVDHACGYAVIYEAMAMGRPVIATRTRAPCDILRDGETGLLVPPHDVVALRAAILRLRDDPVAAGAMGRAAAAIAGKDRIEDLTARIVAVARHAVTARR